jgi:hypothetical protein
MAVWYSLWSFGTFFPSWYVRTKKNLATLPDREVAKKIDLETHPIGKQSMSREGPQRVGQQVEKRG